jgi:hypothetical protein
MVINKVKILNFLKVKITIFHGLVNAFELDVTKKALIFSIAKGKNYIITEIL